MDPSLANVWFNLANAYLQLGQEQEASRWWVLEFCVPQVESRQANSNPELVIKRHIAPFGHVLPVSLHEKLRLDPNGGVTTKYLLASLESQPDRLTEEDQVR